MQSRKEIEKSMIVNRFGLNMSDIFIIKLLLDIRDLLTKKRVKKK